MSSISASQRAAALDPIDPIDPDELDARATRAARLVSFDDRTEPAPRWDTTTLLDNPPLR